MTLIWSFSVRIYQILNTANEKLNTTYLIVSKRGLCGLLNYGKVNPLIAPPSSRYLDNTINMRGKHVGF
jgi:hypothetical protein